MKALPSETRSPVKTITYGDFMAQFFLWQKSILLVPIWGILLIPVVGLIFRGMGQKGTEIGYALVLCLCVFYLLGDLLKRKIRIDDEHIYFGYRTYLIKDIVAIDISYKRKKFLPGHLTITCASGKRLKLSLNSLSRENVDSLLRHLKDRNSNLETAPVLSTLVKCHRVKPKPLLDTADRLELPYHSRRVLDESFEIFKATAQKWMRVGPILFCIFCAPFWIGFLSNLYLLLQPNSWQILHSLNFHQFLFQFFSGLQSFLLSSANDAGASFIKAIDNTPTKIVAGLVTFSLAAYFQRLIFKPNALIADKKGIELVMRFGDVRLHSRNVPWEQIARMELFKPKGSAGIETWKIRIMKTNGKKFDIDLAALSPEDRSLLLKRMEKLVSNCQIDHELSQSMLPKAEHSYTELWLQSLSQAPERKALDPLEPGQVVGDERFEVLRSLGVGGQGTAYLCRKRDNAGAPNVVLKETIIPVFAADAIRRKALERFEHEARMLESLNSDNIVKLEGYFVEDHRAYLILEHVDGCSLRELVQRDGPLSNEQVQDIALQMCDALRDLHKHSIVHRDFTPDNLLLNSKQQLKLIDFNVAQDLHGGTSGTIVGKHANLPPEQIRGKATSQSDLYAFGATLHYLLTGQDPEPISQSSPASHLASVSEHLDKIVQKATALHTKQRYQNTEEIQADLLKSADAGQILSSVTDVREKIAEHG